MLIRRVQPNPRATIRTELLRLAKAAGLVPNLKSIAQAAGLARSVVTRAVYGQTTPNADAIEKLAAALKAPPSIIAQILGARCG
jgi:transcriptional regulator with XRE-family HTH domain